MFRIGWNFPFRPAVERVEVLVRRGKERHQAVFFSLMVSRSCSKMLQAKKNWLRPGEARNGRLETRMFTTHALTGSLSLSVSVDPSIVSVSWGYFRKFIFRTKPLANHSIEQLILVSKAEPISINSQRIETCFVMENHSSLFFGPLSTTYL